MQQPRKERNKMERLYNNIILPDPWPPIIEETTLDKPIKCLEHQIAPGGINIDIGRQLFVDDFLIEEMDLTKKFHQPVICETPVFQPETPLEKNDGYCTCACPFNDGIFYDDEAGKFKMWYHAGWFDGVGYAESEDGIHWKRLKELYPDREDERLIKRKPGWLRDGSAMWIDYDAQKPNERYKMLIFYRVFDFDVRYYHKKPKHSHDIPGSVPPVEKAILYKSHNGIDWEEVGEAGACGDNTTFFYNPFRKKWVFSLRIFSKLDSRVRTRGYYESDDFYKFADWKPEDIRFWSRADIYDLPDPALGYYTQLYNLDATPYESIMLGFYSIFMGPPNNICEITKKPKLNDLKLAYSRDGFYWDRPAYDDFISSSRKEGAWDYGYTHAVNGGCLVVGDEIYFYFSAFSGDSPAFGSHKYSGGNVGLAKLRRDGFASLEAKEKSGKITTKKLEFSGDYLFINADSSRGKIYVEVLDQDGVVLSGFSKADCLPVSINGTKIPVKWKERDLKAIGNQAVKFRFYLENAGIYSFWVSAEEEGYSLGYMAAGGPGFYKGQDVPKPM